MSLLIAQVAAPMVFLNKQEGKPLLDSFYRFFLHKRKNKAKTEQTSPEE